MNVRKFFTTLLAITWLLDFWVHYPTLPYPKLKYHYPSGPAKQSRNHPVGFEQKAQPWRMKDCMLNGTISRKISWHILGSWEGTVISVMSPWYVRIKVFKFTKWFSQPADPFSKGCSKPKQGKTSNVKCESIIKEVTVNPLGLKAKQTTCIDSNIERLSERFACTKCDDTRVAKCHRYGRYICVKILESWGKRCRRPRSFVKWSSF